MKSIVQYGGWNNCLRLANNEIELMATLDAGPRIIRLGFIGEQNEFAEYPEQVESADDGSYHSYGGHRLWAAPEVPGWTNHPDNNPVEWEEEDDKIILTPPIESGTKLQKQIGIYLYEGKNHIRIIHTITNYSRTTVKLAPWAISVMCQGGRVIIPQEPFISHAEHVLPVRPLVVWGYTEMEDSRWTWGNRFIQLRQDPNAKTVQKFGALVTQGWAAYFNNRHLFLKRFPHITHSTYPDFGCNAEFFTNQRMLEVESLGPVVPLKAGGSTTHQEDWFLFRNVQIGCSEQKITEALDPILKSTLL